MRATAIRSAILPFMMGLFLIIVPPHAGAAGKASHLYNLSNFTGIVPFTWVRVVVDDARKETYVCDGNSVIVFNTSGMEVYRISDDIRLGRIFDLNILDNGDLLLLSHLADGSGAALVRCDYRGEPLERRLMKDLSESLAEYHPTRMVARGGKLYLADLPGMKVAVVDRSGGLVERRDLAEMLGMDGQNAADAGLGGFDVDEKGNLYFTLTTQFKVYRLSHENRLESFGQPGSSPGKFGVIAGVAADRSGAIYVVDTLKCMVMVFDRDFKFLFQIGNRSWRPGGLIAPKEATVSVDGRLYVTQQGKRGVSVYQVSSN